MSTKAKPRQLVFMGVCGSGKTTVAGIVADRLGLTVAEADDFHSEHNVAKMASGQPLTDEDRQPWLESIRNWMVDHAEKGEIGIITCSALKRSYRDILRECPAPVIFIHLDGERELISRRLAARSDHFMPPALLDSQLETLEPLGEDENGVVLEITNTPQQLADEIMDILGIKSPRHAHSSGLSSPTT